MTDDLLLFISHHDCNLVDPCADQAFDLVVKNGCVLNLDQAFGTLAVDRTNSSALPGR
jgi:hypothetical protein